ncbi:hypothetical protein [Nonomuraea sp. NPDC049784]|uniref:hypothetical protein n=1 Tax=Nonomuraea sp. NPDC049784 TaxID=3154361 RepID=UPI0033C075BC
MIAGRLAPRSFTRAGSTEPTEGVWSHLKRSLGNLAACTLDELAALMRTRLEEIRRPALLDVARTGLIINPEPP